MNDGVCEGIVGFVIGGVLVLTLWILMDSWENPNKYIRNLEKLGYSVVDAEGNKVEKIETKWVPAHE